MQARVILSVLALMALALSPVSAQQTKREKVSKDWAVYSHSGDKGKMCYAMSQPKSKAPKSLNHGDVYFFITDRPAENVRNEPSVKVGYQFKSASQVKIDIDGQAFIMNTDADGAFMNNPTEDAVLVAAMKKGRKMVVSGTSRRGNSTKYDYSLSGVTAALQAVASACK